MSKEIKSGDFVRSKGANAVSSTKGTDDIIDLFSEILNRSISDIELQKKLVTEELMELLDAAQDDDEKEIIDAICDLYIVTRELFKIKPHRVYSSLMWWAKNEIDSNEKTRLALYEIAKNNLSKIVNFNDLNDCSDYFMKNGIGFFVVSRVIRGNNYYYFSSDGSNGNKFGKLLKPKNFKEVEL